MKKQTERENKEKERELSSAVCTVTTELLNNWENNKIVGQRISWKPIIDH